MPAPAGYVGYTVVQRPVFKTCVNAHANPLHTPSMRDEIQKAVNAGFPGGFSLFEYVVTLNNLNGGAPVPAGHVIVGRVDHAWSRLQPCNVPRQPKHEFYYEKFGANPTDVSFFITGCNSWICYHRVVEFAIMPDPAPGTPVPANERAVSFAMNAAQQAAFAAAVTLRFYTKWYYDNCNNPPNAALCRMKHCLEFTAETFDPAVQPPRMTWTVPGAPLPYSSN
jgi:hypothetical protein